LGGVRAVVRGEQVVDGGERLADLGRRGAGVQRAVEVRVELALLPRRRAHGDDAQLAHGERQRRAAEHLAVPLDDHPRVERGVEGGDVAAQAVVERPVHGGARHLAAVGPAAGGGERRVDVGRRRGAAGRAAPLAHRVERPREAGEQVRLQDHLLHPDRVDAAGGVDEDGPDGAVVAGGDDRGGAHEGARRVIEGRSGGGLGVHHRVAGWAVGTRAGTRGRGG
jgi:hypothetical protein